MKELKPLEMLIGRWSGKGHGTYGPFTARVIVEERGRWLLMRQEIRIPVVPITVYVSTQVYGFDESGLTLDYFDTAGSFRFHGKRDGDTLALEWHDGPDVKTSRYSVDGDCLRFAYDSVVREGDSGDPMHTAFEGTLERDGE
jgi:hypothetical protein